METFCVVILVLMTLFHMYLLYSVNSRNGTVGIYSAVIFSMILFFDILPIIFFSADKSLLVLKEKQIVECNIYQFLLAEFSVLVFTISFHIAYIKKNNSNRMKTYYFNDELMMKALTFVSFFSFIIGSISLILYIYSFGGISNVLYYANYLRNFYTSGTEFVSRLASITIVPAKLILVTPISLYPLISKEKRYYILKIVVFAISTTLSILFLLINAGKTDIIIFIIALSFPILKKLFRHPWRFAVIAGVLFVPFLALVDNIFEYFRSGVFNATNDSTFYANLNQFAHPYLNILYLEEITREYGVRWCSDFITGILNLIPGISFDPSYVITSEFFNGPRWRYTGGRPVDIISFGNLELSIVGVILVAVLYGSISGNVDLMISEFADLKKYYALVASIIANSLAFMINSDISVVLRGQFQYTLMIACVLYATLHSGKKGRVRFRLRR